MSSRPLKRLLKRAIFASADDSWLIEALSGGKEGFGAGVRQRYPRLNEELTEKLFLSFQAGILLLRFFKMFLKYILFRLSESGMFCHSSPYLTSHAV